MLQGQNGPRTHESSVTYGYRSDAQLFASGSARIVNGTPRLNRSSVFFGISTSPADEKNVRRVFGVDVLSATQDKQHARVLHNRRPHTALDPKRKCPAQRRRTLLWVMLTAKSADRAWPAYQELLSYQAAIPNHLLHRLIRHLAAVKPRTRTVYLQLLSVMNTLQRNHGQLCLWEWNTLIDCAGKQWHKTRLEDYENCLEIFNKKGALPAGNVISANASPDSATDSYPMQQDPDIWTYNILLSTASRSASPLTVRHASSLLLASGLLPNRYTHLCLLHYSAVRKDLGGVRSTLRKMKQQGLEVGLDGVNACLWAYARNARFDVALRIYHVLRSNSNPTPNLEECNVEDDSRYIRETVGLDSLGGTEPDEITYTMMIQALAYHGDLRNALSIFVDMLSTPNREARTNESSVNLTCYQPSMAAFRGLFLGFSRHGWRPEQRTIEAEPVSALFSPPQSAWDLDTLETVFAAFLRLPSVPKPTGRLVYWILVAFDKTSGKDPAKLREVWSKLEAKYGGNWGGRLENIRKSIFEEKCADAHNTF